VLSCKAGSHEQATQALRVLRQVGLVGSKGVVKEVIFMMNMILFMEKLMLNMILLCAIFMLNIIFIISKSSSLWLTLTPNLEDETLNTKHETLNPKP